MKSPARMASSLALRDSYSKLTKEELIQRLIALEASSNLSIGTSQLPNQPDLTPSISSPSLTTKRPLSPSDSSSSNPYLSSTSPPKKKQKKPHREFDFSKYEQRRIALRMVYFGWNYHGLAMQQEPNTSGPLKASPKVVQSPVELDTIESRVFAALKKVRLIEDDIKKCQWTKCGRTDKGVSAFDQVVALRVRAHASSGASEDLNYLSMINRHLPRDIRVYAWAPVGDDFNARFDCEFRRYWYFFPGMGLHLGRMQEACQKLVGTHDFRHFCKYEPSSGVTHFVRNILHARIRPVETLDHDEEENNEKEWALGKEGRYSSFYVFDVKGSAFLWHQVRCMMGVLFLVGRGKEDPSIVDKLLDVDLLSSRPQYEMASDVPLVLCKSGFDVPWRYGHGTSSTELQRLVHHVADLWRDHQTRSLQLSSFLNLLTGYTRSQENANSKEPEQPKLDCFYDEFFGLRHKTYIPLLQRPRCGDFMERLSVYQEKKGATLCTKDNNDTKKTVV